jgi:hypothetical protein
VREKTGCESLNGLNFDSCETVTWKFSELHFHFGQLIDSSAFVKNEKSENCGRVTRNQRYAGLKKEDQG